MQVRGSTDGDTQSGTSCFAYCRGCGYGGLTVAEDDDRESEWDDDPTVLDGGEPVENVPDEFSDQVTRANDLAPVLEEARERGVEYGCQKCYVEGQEDAIGALRSLMLECGATNESVAATIAHVRLRLTKL